MPDRPAIPIGIKRQILLESGHRCAVDGTPTPLELAHIIPWHQSKEHKAEDLICLCANCHARADRERWGEKTLWEYKKKPWVMRQYGDSDDRPGSKTRVTLTIDLELEQFDDKEQKWIQSAVAGFLKMSPYAVRKVSIEKGSVKFTIELQADDAEKLLTRYAQNPAELARYLDPIILLDLRQLKKEPEQASSQVSLQTVEETMTPERWQQINALLDTVLERPTDERRAYLYTHAKDDPTLHQEVLTLLQAHEQAQSFLEEPAEEYASPFIPKEKDRPSDPLIDKKIDGYRILGILGRGGMGIVYKAEQEELERFVALKVIEPMLARDEAHMRRFRDEARALARIKDPHIVGVYHLLRTEHGPCLIMEFVEGHTLKDHLIKNKSISWQQALPLIKQMLAALEHAHSVGVIHRDIKPGNVMIASDGVVKVMDFGLAKLRLAGDSDEEWKATITQGVAGTPLYMSPEQVQGRDDLDHRSDLYSLGVTIYEMLAGRHPLDRDAGVFAIQKAIVEEKLLPPSTFEKDLPPALDRIIMKALTKDPARRFQSAAEMQAAFDALVMSTSPPVRRRYLLPIGVSVAVVALIGYFLWPRPPAPAVLSLTTVPDGATVYLNKDSLGMTPLPDHSFEAFGDPLELRLEKQGFLPLDTTFQIAPGDSVSLNIPLALPEVITALLVITQEQALRQRLETYKNANELVHGEDSTDFFYPENCFIFLVDQGVLVAVLSPGGTTRTELRSGATIVDTDAYIGTRTSIWVELIP